MDCLKFLFPFAALLCIVLVDFSSCYHEDFSWEDPSAMMTTDLKSRMYRAETSKGIRKYCSCPDVKAEELDPVCASNGALYKSVCHFTCAQLRIPDLVEVDDGRCDSITFKDHKEKKIKYQSHY